MLSAYNHVASRLAVAAVIATLPHLGALAQTFSAPVQLSQNGHLGINAVAIDQGGTALAVWADAGAYYSVHAPGQAWTAPQSMLVPGGFGPFLQMTPAGFATVVSYNSGYGIYATDRPAGGAWTTSVTVVNAPDLVTPSRTGAPAVIFAGNDLGDQVIVWEQFSAGLQIMAVRRPAGGGWGAPETVAVPPAGNLNIALADATIGPQGDVLVAWETFETVCQNRYCAEIDFIVHASREQAGAATWRDSGPLTPGITPDGYVTSALIDAQGHGGLVMQAGMFATSLQATRQGANGGAWGKLVTAFSAPTSGGAAIWGGAAGRHARASVALNVYGSPLQIEVVDGNLATDIWAPPAVLSASDASGPDIGLAFGANAADGVVVTWVDLDDTVRAALRTNGAHAFSPTQTVLAGNSCLMLYFIAPCTAPGVAAINQAGQAVTLFSQTDSTGTVHTLFAVTTN